MLKAEGKTIFLTSHHYKDIEQLCDQVIITADFPARKIVKRKSR